MTQDEIIRMAREAGFQIVDGKLHLYFDGDKLILKPHYIATVVDGLKNFAEIVEQNYIDSVYDLQKENIYTAKHIEAAVLAEREAIAQMFDDAPKLMPYAQNAEGGCLTCGFSPEYAAVAIRARGEK